MAKSLILTAPAKVNFALDVIGKREDGYHLVEMVMQTIDLCDQLVLENRPEEIAVICSHPDVPSGGENLVWKAAHLLRKEYGTPDCGATITITKRIPVAAGLAGGSADAAATLKGLNQLWNLNLSAKELAELGLALGADIPFCLRGGTAMAEGIGEKLTSLPAPPRLWVVLLKPNIGVSTSEVYNSYDNSLVQRRPDIQAFISALIVADPWAMAGSMANVLESVTFARWPLLRRIKQGAIELGAYAALMSGSGPTVFALAQDYHQAVAIVNGLRHLVGFTYITTFKEG